jgi:hypothetical protein
MKNKNKGETMKTKKYGYGVYHIMVNKNQDWSIVNANMYGDLGYTAWTVFDDTHNGVYKRHEAIETFNTLKEAKEFIRYEINQSEERA